MPPGSGTEWAVVLAAGRASRMRSEDPAVPLSAEQAHAATLGRKAMMPVGRPFLDYVIASLADAGVHAVCLVVGPDHADVEERYQRLMPVERLTLAIAVQPEPRGTADALLAARSIVGGAPFLVVNGDNLYPVPALTTLARHPGSAVVGFRRSALLRESNFEAERIARFSVLELDQAGDLRAVIEKPDPAAVSRFGDDQLIGMNAWRFEPPIFDACRWVAPSVRGELELQDAVQSAVVNGTLRVSVIPFAGGVVDLTGRTDVPGVTERLRGVTVRL